MIYRATETRVERTQIKHFTSWASLFLELWMPCPAALTDDWHSNAGLSSWKAGLRIHKIGLK